MKKTLFEYTVVYHDFVEKDGKKECVSSKVIIPTRTELAKNEKDLAFKITREVPEEYATEPDNVEILIRNF